MCYDQTYHQVLNTILYMYHGNGGTSKQQHTIGEHGEQNTGSQSIMMILMIQQLTITKMITIHFT